jgi:single-strand DNA-binding protein
MNSVNIIGRVGQDIEVRFTPSGKAVTELNLAVDDGWGENKKTAWIGVVLWGATAELAGRALQKGDRVGVSGRLSQDEWEDKATGKKQRKTKITGENMTLLSPKRDDVPTSRQPALQQRQNHLMQHSDSPDKGAIEDDDIPF